MAEAVHKRAALTQEEVAAEADTNDGETVASNRAQITTRSLLRKDPDNLLLNKSLWVRGFYVGQAGSAVRVKVVRKTKQDPCEYAVRRTGGTRKTHTLTAKQLLETISMGENKVPIADRGGSESDALKVEVRVLKTSVRKGKEGRRKKEIITID